MPAQQDRRAVPRKAGRGASGKQEVKMLKGVKGAVAGVIMVLAVAVWSADGCAAKLYLRDGKVLTGTVTSSDTDFVTLSTDFGRFTVPRNKVERLVYNEVPAQDEGEEDPVDRAERLYKESRIANGLDGTVVTANRGECMLSDLPVVVDIITRKDIEKTNAKNVADAIARNCGADIISYPEGLSDVGIRGFAPNPGSNMRRTAVLVDGRKILTTNLSTILIDDVERIEVLKGPASYLYGSGGMGGAINIVTKHSREKVKGEVGYEFRTFMAWKGFADIGGSAFPGTDYDLTLLAFEEAQYPVPPANRLWLGNSCTNYNGAYRSGFKLTDNHRIDWRVDMFLAQDMNYAGDFENKVQDPGKKDMSRLTYDVIYGGKTETDEHMWQARFYGGNNVSAYKSQAGYKTNDSRTDYMNISAQDRERFSDHHEVVFGADYNWDKTVNGRCANGANTAPLAPDSEKFNFGVFACDRLRVMDERLMLTLGIRYDGYKLDALSTDFLKNSPGEEYSSSFDPRVAAAWRVSDIAQVHASAGTGFVVPEPYQKIGSFTPPTGDTRAVHGNIDLLPEKNVVYDAGVTFNMPAVYADISYFYSFLNGGIEKTTTGATLTYQNAVNAEAYGIEGKATVVLSDIWGWSKTVRAYANFTWLLKNWDITNQRDVYNVGKFKANCGVDFEGKRMNLRCNYRFVGDRRDLYQPLNEPAQVKQVGNLNIVDVNFNYKIVEWLHASIKIDNLLNQRVEDKYGYPLPGTVVFGGIALKF